MSIKFGRNIALSVVIAVGIFLAGSAQAVTETPSQQVNLAPGWNAISVPRPVARHIFSVDETAANFDVLSLDSSVTSTLTSWVTMADLGQTEFTPLYGYFINNKTGVRQTLKFIYKTDLSASERILERKFTKAGWYSFAPANTSYGNVSAQCGWWDWNTAYQSGTSTFQSLIGKFSEFVDFTPYNYAYDSYDIKYDWTALGTNLSWMPQVREFKSYATYITDPTATMQGVVASTNLQDYCDTGLQVGPTDLAVFNETRPGKSETLIGSFKLQTLFDGYKLDKIVLKTFEEFPFKNLKVRITRPRSGIDITDYWYFGETVANPVANTDYTFTESDFNSINVGEWGYIDIFADVTDDAPLSAAKNYITLAEASARSFVTGYELNTTKYQVTPLAGLNIKITNEVNSWVSAYVPESQNISTPSSSWTNVATFGFNITQNLLMLQNAQFKIIGNTSAITEMRFVSVPVTQSVYSVEEAYGARLTVDAGNSSIWTVANNQGGITNLSKGDDPFNKVVLQAKFIENATGSLQAWLTNYRVDDWYYDGMDVPSFHYYFTEKDQADFPADGLAAPAITLGTITTSSVEVGSLSCYKDTTLADINVVGGETAIVGRYVCPAGSAEDIKLTSMTFGFGNPGFTDNTLQNLTLWVGGVQLGNTLSVVSGSNVFGNLNLTIAKNTTTTFTLKANVAASATGVFNSKLITYDYLGNITGYSGVLTEYVTGQSVIISNPSLIIVAGNDIATRDVIYSPGQTRVQLGKWKISASNSDIVLDKITLTSLDASGIVATDLSMFGALYLYDNDGQMIGEGNYIGGNVVFSRLYYFLPNDATKLLVLKGDIESSGVVNSNRPVRFVIKSDSNIDLHISVVSGDGSEFNPANVNGDESTLMAPSHYFIIHDAHPVIIPLSLGTTLAQDANAKLFKFSVTNPGTRDLRLSSIKFNLMKSGLADGIIRSLKLYEASPAGDIQLPALAISDMVFTKDTIESGFAFDNNNDLNSALDSLLIAPGENRTFIITGDTTDIGLNASNSISVSCWINGATGFSIADHTWNNGDVQYYYTPAGNATELGPFAASDSYDVNGQTLVLNR